MLFYFQVAPFPTVLQPLITRYLKLELQFKNFWELSGGDQQDAGYQSACKDGGITKVGLAETTVTTNGFVLKKTTTVYGE